MTATFVMPADQVSTWGASLDEYNPPATDCTELAGRGTDIRCAGLAAGHGLDAHFGSYTRATKPDGSVVVAVEAFTT